MQEAPGIRARPQLEEVEVEATAPQREALGAEQLVTPAGAGAAPSEAVLELMAERRGTPVRRVLMSQDYKQQ